MKLDSQEQKKLLIQILKRATWDRVTLEEYIEHKAEILELVKAVNEAEVE